jgi:tRNA threonylcarbamoyladenosine biosynthesis protein TsaE
MSDRSQNESAIAVRLPNLTATADLAQRLAPCLRAGDLVALWGDLGAGKTEFARALIRAATASPEEEVPSPSFTLVQTYETATAPIYHFDLYRLRRPEELVELGWDDALAEGIVLVEWPDRAGDLLPKVRLDVSLDIELGGATRRAVLRPQSGWDSGRSDFDALQRHFGGE